MINMNESAKMLLKEIAVWVSEIEDEELFRF